MANNIQYSTFLGGYTLSTVQQADGSHAIQVVEVPPGTSLNLIGTDLFGGKYSRAQTQTDGSNALNVVLLP